MRQDLVLESEARVDRGDMSMAGGRVAGTCMGKARKCAECPFAESALARHARVYQGVGLTYVGNEQAQKVKPRGTGGGAAVKSLQADGVVSEAGGSVAADGQERNFFGKVVTGGAVRPDDACEPGKEGQGAGLWGGKGVAVGLRDGSGKMPSRAPVGPYAEALLGNGGEQVQEDQKVDRNGFSRQAGEVVPGMERHGEPASVCRLFGWRGAFLLYDVSG